MTRRLPPLLFLALTLLAAPAHAQTPDPKDDPQYWTNLLTTGQAAFTAGRYAQAEPPMRELYDNSLAALGMAEPMTQLAGANLGAILNGLGRYDEAAAVLLPILRQRISQFGEDNVETLTTAATYAESLRQSGNLDDARSLQRRILQLHTAADRREAMAETRNDLAATLVDMGRTAEAEPLYRQAWADFTRDQGEDAPKALTAASNLAQALLANDRAAEAEPILRRVLTVRRTTLGQTHPDTIGSLNNLAQALSQLGRHDEARPLQRQAWDQARATLGEDHPNTLTLLSNYVGQLGRAKDGAERERLMRHVLDVRRRTLGLHPDTLRAMNNLAGVLLSNGKTLEAEALQTQAAEGFIEVTPADRPPHQEVAFAWASLGKIRLDLNRPEPAYDAYATAANALRARYTDPRATGGAETARASLEAGRKVFQGQITAGWRWAHGE
jgi:tetratricopeptide (TPR) repeat protein